MVWRLLCASPPMGEVIGEVCSTNCACGCWICRFLVGILTFRFSSSADAATTAVAALPVTMTPLPPTRPVLWSADRMLLKML
jgi:hypothetical protein